MDSPATLQDAILFFSDYRNCHDAVVAIRWPDGGVRCPHCGSQNVTYLDNARVWKCYRPHPKAKFSLKVGTIFEDSAIPLQKWLPALWLLVNCKNGISSYELARALGVTQKTAWFMLARLRMALQSDARGQFSGHVEVDETYIGGKARNMHASKRRARAIQRGRSHNGKVAVMGLLQRHGEGSKVRTAVVPNVRKGHLVRQIEKHVEDGCALYSDALSCRIAGSTCTTSIRSSTTPRSTSTGKSTLTDSKTSGAC
jgi:transposase-like protein